MDTNINPASPSTEPASILPIEGTLKSAWEFVYGFKGTFWLAMLAIFLISLTLVVAEEVVNSTAGTASNAIEHFGHNIPLLALLINFIGNVLSVLFSDGLFYIGLRRVANLPIKSRMIFRVFKYPLIFKLIILMVSKTFIILAFVLIILLFGSIIPATGQWNILTIVTYFTFISALFYIFIRLSLSELFILDKGVGPITSMKLSFQTTAGFSWKILWLIILQVLILLISTLPLAIGLIWTIPLVYLAFPVIYNKLVGISMKE